MKRFIRLFWLAVYYGIGYWLPNSYLPVIGKFSNWVRIRCVHHIFAKCGKIRCINRGVYFHRGTFIEIGDESGIGADCDIPEDTIIGKNVMISRNVFILNRNHKYDRLDIPINDQGYYDAKRTVIEDDVWIGLRSILTPGRCVRKGTIVAMGSVLTKDFPEYSVVGGNPAKFIKSRLPEDDLKDVAETK
ncbi:MAG: acyltransferase [Prevotella sp.]|nr:acyltransferase [Prevotella sp.]